MSRSRAVIVAVTLALIASVVVVLTWPDNTGVTEVGSGGGVAVSEDSAVSVTFAAGEMADDTEVTVLNDDRSAPLLPPGFIPIAPPFSITPQDSGNHTGTVTVRYPELPSGLNPESIVMSVADGDQWEALETTVDPAAHTVTAQWPHFSKGGLSIPSPLGLWDSVKSAGSAAASAAAGAGNAAVEEFKNGVSVAWDRVDSARQWLGEEYLELMAEVGAKLVPMVGGTTDAPDCDHPVGDWVLTGSKPSDSLFAALAGCTEPRLADGSWRVKINNKTPFPYLVSVPTGMTLNWTQILDAGYSIEDTLIALVEMTGERAMIGGGGTLELSILNGAPASMNVEGYVDPYSTGASIVMTIAGAVTLGKSIATKAELNLATRDLDKLVREKVEEITGTTSSGPLSSTPLDVRQRVEDELGSDLTDRQDIIRDLRAKGHDIEVIDAFFAYWDLANCLIGEANTARGAASEAAMDGLSAGDVARVSLELAKGYADACYGDLVGRVMPLLVSGMKDQVGEVVTAVVESVQSIIEFKLLEAAVGLQAFSSADYLETSIKLNRSASIAGEVPVSPAPAAEIPAVPNPSLPPSGGSDTAIPPVVGNFDWRTIAYADAGCASRQEFVEFTPDPVAAGEAWDRSNVLVSPADMTADPGEEVAVQVQCPSQAASNQLQILVYAFPAGTPTPVLRDSVPDGGSPYWVGGTSVQLSSEDDSITIDGPSVGPTDPRGAPSYRSKAVYQWDGTSFVQRSLEETSTGQPAAPGSLADVPSDILLLPTFRTPSGNILCAHFPQDGVVSCTIFEHNFSAAETCDIGEPGLVVDLRSVGAPQLSPCVGDRFTEVAADAPTLPYNTEASIGDSKCVVTEVEISCANPENHGFTLSREAYASF